MGDLYGNTFSDMPLSSALFFQFKFGKLLLIWFFGVIFTALFTLIPSLKSAFVEPVEALRR
jgi:putative ABC transport system permease protein